VMLEKMQNWYSFGEDNSGRVVEYANYYNN
jgi:hypothetical protein